MRITPPTSDDELAARLRHQALANDGRTLLAMHSMENVAAVAAVAERVVGAHPQCAPLCDAIQKAHAMFASEQIMGRRLWK